MAENWGYILKRIADEKGLNQPELSRLAGISQGDISKAFSGKVKEPKPSTVAKFARALDMSTAELSGRLGIAILQDDRESYSPEEKTVQIPDLGYVPAGIFDVIEESRTSVKVPQSWLNGASRQEDIYALHVSGNSLKGDDIEDGDIILVDRGAGFVNGAIYIVRKENECVARHVYRESGHVRLISSNGQYEDIQADDVELRGMVFYSYKPGIRHWPLKH